MLDYKELQSKVIDLLHFPLIVAVVFIHGVGKDIFNNFNFIPSNDFILLTNLTTNGICRIAVPLFFLISGYLFFAKKWNMRIYKEKLKRRVHSLLIPYLLFNLIGLIIIGAFQLIVPEMISGNYKTVPEYGLIDFLLAFWKMDKMNIPFVAPLWFIRNLMVVMLLSPLIYWGIKKLGGWFVLLFLISWYVNFYTFAIPGTMCLAFFSLGGWLRISGKNMVEVIIPYRKYSFIIYPILLLIGALTPVNSLLDIMTDNAAILCGIVASVGVASWGVEHYSWKIPVLFTSATFFVYAAHVPYIGQFIKILLKFIPKSIPFMEFDVIAWLMHLIVPIIFISLLIMIYHLLKKIFPHFTSLLVGERK